MLSDIKQLLKDYVLFKKYFSRTFLAATVSLLINTPVLADINEIYHLSVGSSLETYDTQLSINSRNQSVNKEINFEDDLGYDSKINSGWISGWYRVGDLHRIKLTYTPISRKASIQNFNDIILDNTTIKSGSTIVTDSQSEILDFSYIYSFIKKPDLELGFSAGIYWFLNTTLTTATGNIQAEGEDQAVFMADYSSRQKLQAPMPLIGFTADYEISPSWRTRASLRYLSLPVGNIDGSILSADAGTEYYFNNNWGVGASLAYFDMSVEVQGLANSAFFNWAHNGIQIYAVYKY